MGKFLLGILVGIILVFLFLMLGGGKTLRTVGENITETGKRMQLIEESIRKDKETIENVIKKKFSKEEKEGPKKTQ
jgi:hypothetical protein